MKAKLFSIFFLFAILFFGFASHSRAEVIRSFDVDIVAHKNGLMDVREKIVYDFEDEERHGIFRYIPLYSKVGDLYRVIKINNVEVKRDNKTENFEQSQTKEQIYFKIGDADKTVKGQHIYEISYTVENAIGSNYETHDEIYWDVTGNEWGAVIEKASVRIETDFGIAANRVACFTRDANLNAQFCTFPSNFNPVTTTAPLTFGDGLTVVYGYPVNTFPKSILTTEPPKATEEKIGEFLLKNLGYIWGFFNIIVPAGLITWYQKKKNKKRFGPPSVNFDTPEDEKGERITPALAGTIDTAKLERDDVIATLFDLAIRKYIKLEEIKMTKSMMPDIKKQKITKLKEGEGLNAFERTLFNRLFRDGGNYVFVDELKKDFYKTYQSMEEEAFNTLVDKKYYVKNPKVQRGFLLVFGLMALFSGNAILGAVLIFLSRKLIGRTAIGDEIDHKIDGLKLFLKSMDRNYEWQTKKFITLEQMIPYAMALGFIDKFMDQLKIVEPDYNPTWYHGSSGNFYRSFGVFSSSMSSNVTTSAPSSSSGFSGGSSGGGGGGGGGGSW